MESEEVRASGPVEEPMSSVIVMPAELCLEMPESMEMQVMPAERKVEREHEVRLRISGGKMKGITEAHQKDPVLKELESLNPVSSSRCIYRVPKRLRQGNEKAYTPQVVSIGPLHHGEEPLKAMEEHKLRYLRSFLDRTGVSYSDYIQRIKKQEGRLRDFYAESVEFGSDEFVRIVLVDAAFVIELLLRDHNKKYEGEDYIFKNPRMLFDVRPDLRLLENQLPFFILQDLFSFFSSSSPPSLLDISYNFFEGVIDSKGKKTKFDEISSSKVQVKHFVDLIRKLYLPSNVTEDQETEHTDTPNTTATANVEEDQETELTDTPNTTATANVTEDKETEHTDTPNTTATPNVTELHHAGVKLKVGKGSSLFDITFLHGILEIPKLTVDDTKELTLRNLLAFEQCHHREADYLANYIFLMKRLVKTPEDVQLLVDKGIIDNWLGDNHKISTLLRDLGTGMMVDPHFYATHCKNLIKYREKCWRGSMVTLKQKYFKTPWSTMSLLAAIILLFLTALQTLCTYKSAPLL